MHAPDSASIDSTDFSWPQLGRAPVPDVGRTPLLRLGTIGGSLPARVELWGKAEFFNPTRSVKDRAAYGIVRQAIREGRLGRGQTLIDASSGNTGAAYAALGATVGFPVELYIPRNAHPERLDRMRRLGATVILTDPLEGTDGAQRQARRRAEDATESVFFADQYNNPANPQAHYETTGPEIWSDTDGRVTHLVAGVGTGGTISGTGRYLKERNHRVQVIAVEPNTALHGIEGLKHLPTAIRPGTFDARVVDRTIRIETETAQAMADRLASEEGLTVGRSSGAAIGAALEVGTELREGVIVAILPDGEPTPHPRSRSPEPGRAES